MCGRAKCPQCGADVYATDTQCVSCGARVEWRRSGERSVTAPQVPEVSAHGRPARHRWLQVFEKPWLQTNAYVLWIGFSVIVGIMVVLADEMPSPSLIRPLAVLFLLVHGGMSILMSRALAQSRDLAPFLLRLITERMWARIDYAPWVFRLSGSIMIGYAIGYGCWVAFYSAWGSVVAGLLTGLGVWVWTWFAFWESEE